MPDTALSTSNAFLDDDNLNFYERRVREHKTPQGFTVAPNDMRMLIEEIRQARDAAAHYEGEINQLKEQLRELEHERNSLEIRYFDLEEQMLDLEDELRRLEE